MKKIETGLEGLFILETINFTDNRGNFQKLFNSEWFIKNDLSVDFREFYYSVSQKNVIRGMHFQLPPHDHTKLVYVSKGKILDVVVDLRVSSNTFGQSFSVELNEIDAKYVYISKGFAHGFLSLEEGSIVNYAQTSCYNNEADCGIAFDSFGFDWGNGDFIVSGRDKTFKLFTEFISPF